MIIISNKKSVEKTLSNKMYNKIKWIYLSGIFCVFSILAFYSYPVSDSSLYFHETVHIAETFKQIKWIGNEPIGTHGILFKLIPALLIIIFGVNSFYLNLFHVILSIFTILIFEKILLTFFDDVKYVLSGILIFSSSYIFIMSSFSYMREMPVLFASVLLFYIIVKKKPEWSWGMVLLLILDAKEHVFFQFAPGLFLYSIYKVFWIEKSLLHFVKRNLLYWLPSIIYTLLMVATPLLPINSFLIAILPLSKRGVSFIKTGFELGYLSTNTRDLYSVPVNYGKIINSLLLLREKLANSFLGKPFQPRVLGFISIHFVFVITSLVFSIREIYSSFKEKLSSEKIKNNHLLVLAFMFLSYLAIYIFRTSHGRYLISLSPLIVLFFLLYVKYTNKNIKSNLLFKILIAFSVISIIFELSLIGIKVVLTTVLLFSLYNILFKRKEILSFAFIVLIITSGTTLMAIYSLPEGVLNRYFNYGYHDEVEKIYSEIDTSHSLYTNYDYPANVNSYLLNKKQDYFHSYRYQLIDLFAFRREKLKSYYNTPYVYKFPIDESQKFINNLYELDIHTLVFYKSTNDNLKFLYEDELEAILDSETYVFELQETKELKNKIVKIYRVNSNE